MSTAGSLPTQFRRTVDALKSGRYREAREIMQRAADIPPREPAELVELAQRLLYFNLSGEMRGIAERLLAGPSWHAGAESDFAAMLSMMGEQDMAGRLLDRAMRAGTPGAAQLYNRSQMHLYSGRMVEAERDLLQALAREPRMAKAHWALSKLPALATTPEPDALRQLAAQVPPGSQDEAFLRFALFNHLDREREDEAAWKELARGSQVKRQLLKYDAAATRRLFDALERMPVDGCAAGDALGSDAGPPTPIFIVGMHRSGTTLLERILGNHSQVSEGGELYDFPAQLRLALGRHFNGPADAAVAEQSAALDFAGVGRGYLDQVRWRAHGKTCLVDKLPSNFLNIGFIHQALPAAKVIHMRRGAMDTCYSNFKELFSTACAYSYDQVELADYYAWYRRLMAHWHARFPGFVLDVAYEDLARDPQAQAERILAFCGLDWEPGCLDIGANQRAVNTASSAQVREPIHQRGIGAWRRHESRLAPLATRLAEHGID